MPILLQLASILSVPPVPVVLLPPAQLLVPVSIKILMPVPLLHVLKDATLAHSVQLIVLLPVIKERLVIIWHPVSLPNALPELVLLLIMLLLLALLALLRIALLA